MYYNGIYDTPSEAFWDLLYELMADDTPEVGSRNGRVKEMTHVGITVLDPSWRELFVPGRRPNLAAQIAESVWVLSGRNDIGWLEGYLPRARDFSDDGKTWRGGYGPRLRSWPRRDGEDVSVIDQLAHVVELLREDPLTRRAVINIYDPQTDTAPGKDIPCNNWLSFSSRLGKLDLHVAVRSNDLFWGWSGVNAFEWSVLQEVVAQLVGVNVGALHFSTTSLHLYDRHWKRGREILDGEPGPGALADSVEPVRFDPGPGFTIDKLDELLSEWFLIEACIRNGSVEDSDISDFPEPMLRSWLRVLRWWWTGDTDHLALLEGTRLWSATQFSVQPPSRELPAGAEVETVRVFGKPEPVRSVLTQRSDFLNQVVKLHEEKHAAYGDSWKRRGEMLGIMANIARKVDRLVGGETPDETSADTAVDLMVYLAKYRTWLTEHGLGADRDLVTGRPYSDDPRYVERLLERVETVVAKSTAPVSTDVELVERLTADFEALASSVEKGVPTRYVLVDQMLSEAYLLASSRWSQAQWRKGNERRFWKGYEA